MSDKPIRLGKAASELNVGLPTLIEFLATKGIVIDSNPNSKLDPEHFHILRSEFAADQTLKDQSKAALIKEKKETISLQETKPEPSVSKSIPVEDDGDEINLDEIKRSVLGGETSSSKPKEPTINVVGKINLDEFSPKKKAETPKVEEVKSEATTPEPQEKNTYE